MSVFVSMIVLAVLASVFAVRLRYRDEGLFSTTFVFSLGAFVYFLSIPMEHFLLGQESLPMRGVYFTVPVGPDFYVSVFSAGLAGILAFALGLKFSGFKSLSADRAVPDTGDGVRIFETALWLFWASLILFIALFFHDYVINASQSYEASYATQYDRPVPNLALQLIALLNAVLAVMLATRNRLLPILGAGLLFAANIWLSYLFHEKSQGVIAVIGMGYLYFYWIRNNKLAIAGALLGVLIMLFVLKPVYNIVQQDGGNPAEVFAHWKDLQISFTVLDSSGPMIVAATTLTENKSVSYGLDIIKSFAIFVPRALWPDRPADPSETFAQRMIPNWKPGMGLGYSPVVEGVANFGFWLSPLEFLVFGILWGLIWRGFMHAFAGYKTPMHLDIFYRIAGYYLLILFFRGLMAGSIKQALMYIIPVSIALGGMQLLVWLWARYRPNHEVAA